MKNDPGVKLSPAKSCFWTAVFVALSVTMVLREELVCGEVAHAEDVLTDAVPADVSWYLHVDLRSSDSDDGTLSEGVASLATGELAAQFVSLRSRLTGVKFVESFDSELHSELSEERQKERTYWRALLEEPAWWQLFAREFIIAGRVEFGEGRRAWLGAFRVEASERKGILDAFRELLFALASVIPQAEILEATATGADRSLCLYSDLNPGAEFCVGGSGEIHVPTAFNEIVLAPQAGGEKLDLYTIQKGNRTYRLTFKADPVDDAAFLKAWEASFDWEMMRYPVLTRVRGGEQIYLQGERYQVRTLNDVTRQQMSNPDVVEKIRAEFGVGEVVARRAFEVLARKE